MEPTSRTHEKIRVRTQTRHGRFASAEAMVTFDSKGNATELRVTYAGRAVSADITDVWSAQRRHKLEIRRARDARMARMFDSLFNT